MYRFIWTIVAVLLLLPQGASAYYLELDDFPFYTTGNAGVTVQDDTLHGYAQAAVNGPTGSFASYSEASVYFRIASDDPYRSKEAVEVEYTLKMFLDDLSTGTTVDDILSKSNTLKVSAGGVNVFDFKDQSALVSSGMTEMQTWTWYSLNIIGDVGYLINTLGAYGSLNAQASLDLDVKTIEPAATPVPGAIWLLGSGLAGLLGLRKRKAC